MPSTSCSVRCSKPVRSGPPVSSSCVHVSRHFRQTKPKRRFDSFAPSLAMRTRGAEGSPLRTPQLWQFWERDGKSPAAQAGRTPAALQSPAAAPRASPAAAARGGEGTAAPPAEEAAAAASPVASDGSPADRRAASRPVSPAPLTARAPRLQLAQAPSIVGVAQRQVGGGAAGVPPGAHALRDDPGRRGAGENGVRPERCAACPACASSRARSSAHPAVQAGQTTPLQTSPTPAQPAGVQQEPAARGEPGRQQRVGDWRLAARVPRHLGALTNTHLPLMGMVGAVASHTAAAGGGEASGASAAGAEAAALPPPGPPTLVWDVLCDEAVCRVKVRHSELSGCTPAAELQPLARRAGMLEHGCNRINRRNFVPR